MLIYVLTVIVGGKLISREPIKLFACSRHGEQIYIEKLNILITIACYL